MTKQPNALSIENPLAVGAPTTNGGRNAQEQQEIRKFSQKLHELMLAKGMSQSDLARAVWGTTKDGRGYDVAKNRDRISAYLRGTSIPEPNNMKEIARVLNVEIKDLAPDLTASAVDRGSPAVRMTVIAGHPDKTHLQIDVLTTMSRASRVIAILSEDDEK